MDEPGDKFKFKYQIISIKYQNQVINKHQVSKSRAIPWWKRAWRGIHVQVQVSSIVYQVSNIKHQVSLLGGCEPGEVLEDQFLPVLRKALGIRRGGDGKMKRG